MPRWTEEVFIVTQVLCTNPPTLFQGSIYEPQVQKTNQNVYWIEKVIRKRGNKSLVKWLGYSQSFN